MSHSFKSVIRKSPVWWTLCNMHVHCIRRTEHLPIRLILPIQSGISLEGHTKLLTIGNCTLTFEIYAQEIVNEYTGPYLANIGDESMLIHNNITYLKFMVGLKYSYYLL